MDENGNETTTALCFTLRSSIYDSEKPFTIQRVIEGWEGEIPRTNLQEEHFTTSIQDIRGRESDFSLEENGFMILRMDSSLSYEDFAEPAKIEKVYCQEVATRLLEHFETAAAVQISDIQIRRRHPQYPNIAAGDGIPEQPASRVHLDASRETYIDLLDELGGDLSSFGSHLFVKYDHNIYVRLRGLTKSFVDSVWKPLCGPVCDWPLAVCDTQTVDASQDLTNHDVVLGTKTRENVMVFHNPAQRWYYLKGQMPWELWVFRQADSEGHQGVPHAAFNLETPTQPTALHYRESIELRAIVCFNR